MNPILHSKTLRSLVGVLLKVANPEKSHLLSLISNVNMSIKTIKDDFYIEVLINFSYPFILLLEKYFSFINLKKTMGIFLYIENSLILSGKDLKKNIYILQLRTIPICNSYWIFGIYSSTPNSFNLLINLSSFISSI